jgi:ribonuclease Z
VVPIAGETLQVFFLGTAGALPTTQRNPSCIMVKHGSSTLLFDCGEGAQQQMMRARTGFSVEGIFFTHWHADHFLGVFGLVQTLSFTGRTDPLTLYGPGGVEEFAALVRHVGKYTLNFPLKAVEVHHGTQVTFAGFSVRVFATNHGIPSFGYVFCEDIRPGRFDRDRAIALGLQPGPLFGRLQRGESVQIMKNGELWDIAPSDVMGPPRPGRKVIYTGDTRPVQEQIAAVAGEEADLLIHDATFEDSARERAVEVFHATAGEAGEVARMLRVHTLALVHISSRYTSNSTHCRDAEKQFSGTVIAPTDLTMLEIHLRG